MTGDIKKDIEIVGNIEPFIPFCQLENVWSDPPNWGSKYNPKEKLFDLGFGDMFSDYENTIVEMNNDIDPLHNFCTLFKPSITDKGICYTFNGIPSRDLLVESEFMDAYGEVFALPSEAYNDEKFVGNGPGILNGLRLILDAHTLDAKYKIFPKNDNTFRLSFQHPKDFPLPLMEGITVAGGYKTR